MKHDRDDWPKTRGRHGHLTDAEKEIVKQGFQTRRSYRDVARELGCSSRIVSKYYGFHRAEGIPQGPHLS